VRILVADDDPLVVEVVSDILTGLGHEVQTAVDGGQALRALERESFALIFTDLRMPVVSGEAVVSAARARSNETVIIAITGDATGGLDEQLRAAGADEVLYKPVPLRELQRIAAWADTGRRLPAAPDKPREEPVAPLAAG
jgi:CheY-like chemotaxis protein